MRGSTHHPCVGQTAPAAGRQGQAGQGKQENTAGMHAISRNCRIFACNKQDCGMETLLTVIIPVFNAGDYLRPCVESVAGQLPDGCEALLVDDGSTDGSGEACDELSRRYAGVRVIHKANGGVSSARNAGLDAARGRYIAFADADDTVAPGTYEANLRLLEADPEADFLEFPARMFCGSPREHLRRASSPARISGGDAFAWWFDHEGYLYGYLWNKLFRRELFAGVRFPEGHVYEDLHVLALHVIPRTKRFLLSTEGMYCYHSRAGSLTVANTYGRQRDFLHTLRLIRQESLRHAASPEAQARFAIFAANVLTDLLDLASTRRERRQALQEAPGVCLSLKTLWQLRLPLAQKAKNLALALAGIRAHSLLMHRLHRLRRPRRASAD